MALFCRCDEALLRIEKREVHLLFEILEEAIESNGLAAETNGLLMEIRDLLKDQDQVGKEAKLVIPIGTPVEQ